MCHSLTKNTRVQLKLLYQQFSLAILKSARPILYCKILKCLLIELFVASSLLIVISTATPNALFFSLLNYIFYSTYCHMKIAILFLRSFNQQSHSCFN